MLNSHNNNYTKSLPTTSVHTWVGSALKDTVTLEAREKTEVAQGSTGPFKSSAIILSTTPSTCCSKGMQNNTSTRDRVWNA